MRILFTSEAVIEICNGEYHKTNTRQFIERYQYFGDVIFCGFKKEVEQSRQPIIDKSIAQFVFLTKETDPRTYLQTRKANKQILERIIPYIDILVAHLPSRIGSEAISIAKKYKKPYFIGVVGCAWDAYWNYGIKGKLVAVPFFFEMRRLVKQSPFAFYVTQKFLQNRYPCKGYSIGCSNVEIPTLYDQILKQRQKKINSNNYDVINIVTCAAIDVIYKGQEYVIRAIASLNRVSDRKYHYYLVGNGDKSYLYNLAMRERVTDYVHFIGVLPHEEIFAFLDKMDVYIQPSRQEGLPRAVIEAMSRAMVVFGSNTAGIPELLEPECVFKNGDVKKIMELLKGVNNRTSLQYATRNFNEARSYTADVLNERRYKFFDKIRNSVL